jgi:hypothetical protein
MNISKSADYFNPTEITAPIHIIGCGAVGSTLAEMLTRMGCTNLILYDFDTVTPHNIANQMFLDKHIGQPKTLALVEILKSINPDISFTTYEKGWNGEQLSGYVFLAVDDIALRRKIVETNFMNMNIIAMYDFRMGLDSGEHFAANWSDTTVKKNLLKGMDFTTEEAAENTPRNACGTTLNLISTVRTLVSYGITNFIKMYKTQNAEYAKIILINVVTNSIVTF